MTVANEDDAGVSKELTTEKVADSVVFAFEADVGSVDQLLVTDVFKLFATIGHDDSFEMLGGVGHLVGIPGLSPYGYKLSFSNLSDAGYGFGKRTEL